MSSTMKSCQMTTTRSQLTDLISEAPADLVRQADCCFGADNRFRCHKVSQLAKKTARNPGTGHHSGKLKPNKHNTR